MNHEATLETSQVQSGEQQERLSLLRAQIEHATHWLPTQNPIQVFIHHNTLHAFEDRPFFEALKQGGAAYGCNPFLAESDYRLKLDSGRILPDDLAAVLTDELREGAHYSLGALGDRFALRLAMLQYSLRVGTDAEVRWLMTETDTRFRFRPEAASDTRKQLVDDTRRWVMRDLRSNGHQRSARLNGLMATLTRFDEPRIEQWDASTWEAVTLHLLWQVCHNGVHGVRRFAPPLIPRVRHRDLLLEVTGQDTDRLVGDVLIRFCGAFMDQGVAHWQLPDCQAGLFRSWLNLNRHSRPVEPWLHGLPAEIARIEREELTPLQVIDEALDRLGVSEPDREPYISQTLLALRGWAGMVWQMETNAEWTMRPAPAGSLVEYLAVRLVLELLAIEYVARESLGYSAPLSHLRLFLQKRAQHAPRVSVDQRAFFVFQIAQILGWKPEDLHRQSKDEWSRLVEEVEAFSGIERRRVYHLAYERRYRIQTLDAVLSNTQYVRPPNPQPTFQIVCCLDDREESFRRHLEEIDPACETFGVAGFYGVAMYYRGAADAHFVPLCPIVIKPRHFVREEVVYSLTDMHRRRAVTRRVFGKVRHWLHTVSRSSMGGVFTSLFGSLLSVPLLARVLFPRLTARTGRLFSNFVQTPPVSVLSLERSADPPGAELDHCGYTLDEMVDISRRVLQDIGLTSRFARVVILTGHGSSSVNNPHESAYDCGACGGGRGGPNARAFASMLNDRRVRERLLSQGLDIPSDTVFVGGFHNTCDDSVTCLDMDRLPLTHRAVFEHARGVIDDALRRNAHERCRRFESAELSLSTEAALRHVQGRSEDLSQVRPELGHATNAICHVGRRNRVKGLFFDRRAFLTSYDPTQDPDHTILERILQAAIPVCAGINLEYFFSIVDSPGYGCGSKLPHNIASLLGVMDGPASDLRTGLPWQMVEIHEPMRCLFLIETTPEAMHDIIERNPGIKQLVHNEWVQLAVLAPDANSIQVLRRGKFEPYTPEALEIPVVAKSVDWYRGWRHHLGFASIVAPGRTPAGGSGTMPA